MKAEYRNAIRSKKMIREAYMELLKEKEISKITVTDVVRKADINRGTFYAHYCDIRAVGEEIEDNIITNFCKFMDEVPYESFFNNPFPFLMKIVTWLKSDVELAKLMVQSEQGDSLFQKFQDVFIEEILKHASSSDEKKNAAFFKLQIQFFSAGIISLFKSYFKGECDLQLEEIAQAVSEWIKNSSKS